METINKEDFNKKLYSRIEKVIEDYNLIEKNEKIAVALSGGKDSILTLYALAKYQEKKDFELFAISVDEGIKGYRPHGINSAIENTKKLKIPLIQKSFKTEEDFTLDEIYTNFKSACIPCGVFRRNILNKTAYQMGADKIATGHNLDDEIQSFLMSFSRADTIKFSKFSPKLNRIHPQLVPRIKPLWNTPEKEVGLWAILNNIDIHFAECPYSDLSLRAKIKEFLNNAEDKNPGVKKQIMESFKKNLNTNIKIETKLNQCEICREPTSGLICNACDIRKDLNKLH